MSNYELRMRQRIVPGLPLGNWQEIEHIPINDPSLPLLIEQSVKKALSVKGESREAISLLKEIKEQLQVIASEIKYLKPYKEEIIVFRDVAREEAKQDIRQYFESHQKEAIGYSDLVKALKLDLKLIVELCSELENEGLIG